MVPYGERQRQKLKAGTEAETSEVSARCVLSLGCFSFLSHPVQVCIPWDGTVHRGLGLLHQLTMKTMPTDQSDGGKSLLGISSSWVCPDVYLTKNQPSKQTNKQINYDMVYLLSFHVIWIYQSLITGQQIPKIKILEWNMQRNPMGRSACQWTVYHIQWQIARRHKPRKYTWLPRGILDLSFACSRGRELFYNCRIFSTNLIQPDCVFRIKIYHVYHGH